MNRKRRRRNQGNVAREQPSRKKANRVKIWGQPSKFLKATT